MSQTLPVVLSGVPLTCYPGDGDLPAAAALPSLSEGLDLDDVLLVGGQGQLHGRRVGLHDVGGAVSVPLVQHLWAERGESCPGGLVTAAADAPGERREAKYFVL